MKKKLLNILACLGIFMIGAFALIGCDDNSTETPHTNNPSAGTESGSTVDGETSTETPHSHNYANTSYTIEGDRAYKVLSCDCKDFIKTKMENAIIANPETALKILNESNNTTIVLSAGTYELDDLRFQYINTPTNNLTIVGVDGAEVSRIYASVHDTGKITNLRIENIKFTGAGVASNHTDIDGLTVVNCEFVGTAGVTIGNNDAKNVVVQNCVFNLSSDAVETQTAIYINKGLENLLVENCTFANTPYNAIQANAAKVEGDIIIRNNNFVKTGSRIIYINGIENAEDVDLTIENNIFCTPTTPKADGNFVKLSVEIEISKNNIWEIVSENADNYYFAGAVVES